ncbi:unnamed protein product [Leptidea sinapis]|uniref:Uncharacterized protein n=1 Tax=Leptidea sinapis TaxID=189913 RepID=A0A5E4R5S3_9NEOP|nr:unnamed protein product [Leptidea sinapis]
MSISEVRWCCSNAVVSRSDLFAYIDEATQEQWLLGYIELLQRNKLWNVATEVIRCAWLSSVWALSQQSTSVVACCGRCGRRTRPRAPCDRCAPRLATDLCAGPGRLPHRHDLTTECIPEVLRGVEALGLSDGEDAQEALSRAEVVVPDGGVVLLARCVQDVDLNLLAIQHDLRGDT